jgi:hypothetical protein
MGPLEDQLHMDIVPHHHTNIDNDKPNNAYYK